MAEATYFNEPKVQVTTSRVVAPWGEYKTEDIREVEFQHTTGVPKWVWPIFLFLWGVSALFLIIGYITGQEPLGIPRDVFSGIGALGLLVYSFILVPRSGNIVQMKGTFGRVTFDCGDNENYALRLKAALDKAAKATASQTENRSGVGAA